MRNCLMIMAALVSLGCSNAQKNPPTEPKFQKVIPGDRVLIPGRIQPHQVRYSKTSGSMLYIMKEVEREGKSVYELAVYFNADESAVPDRMYFDKHTLGYVGRRLEMKAYTIDVSFSTSQFTGELIPAEGSDFRPRKYDKTYPHNAFEPAIINYFIAALPLAPGYKASIPVFDLNDGSQMYWSDIEVLKQEKITVGDRTYDTWKVISRGIKEKTIWVSTEVPYAIKMKTKGSFGTWELVP